MVLIRGFFFLYSTVLFLSMELYLLSKEKMNYYINTFWILFEPVFKLIVSLFVMSKIARHFGVTEFGVYSFVTATVIGVDQLSRYGLEPILVKLIVNEKNSITSIREKFSSIFSFRLVSSSLFFLILNFYSYLSFEGISRVGVFVLSFYLLLSPFELVTCFYQANINAKFILE